jgi:hypothetical protein
MMTNFGGWHPGLAARSMRRLAVQFLTLFVAFSGVLPVQAASEPLADGSIPLTQTTSFERHYKATAYVTLLSITIFSRSGVGFGFAGTNMQENGAQQKFSLRFLSGSTPERAHGLNRFGFIQEHVEELNRATVTADYFGLMTANGEESLSDAKAALETKGGQNVPFVAARAVIDQQKTDYSVRHMLLPSSFRGSNADELLQRVQAEFALAAPGQVDKTEQLNGQSTGTFLNSLRQAIVTDADSYDSRIVFNGKTFRFRALKRNDTKAGAEFQKGGLTESAQNVMMLNGSLRNEKTNETTTFRLWFEKGSANFLPLRFEFKPKSYLRLVFDGESAR